MGFATFLPWYVKAFDYINNLMLLVKKVGSDKYIARILDILLNILTNSKLYKDDLLRKTSAFALFT